MVCTYNEPAETVKSCVEYLLASEAPVYCEKVIYIGDDGAKKKFQCSEDKRVMCEDFHKRVAPPTPLVAPAMHTNLVLACCCVIESFVSKAKCVYGFSRLKAVHRAVLMR